MNATTAEHAAQSRIAGAKTGRVDGWIVVASLGAVAIGYLIALILNGELTVPDLEIGSDFAVFAIFYIVAQALERLLEPFAAYIGGEQKEEAKQKVAGADAQERAVLALLGNSNGEGDLTGLVTDAKEAKKTADADLARIRANRTVALWAVATTLGMAISGALGLYFVQTVATPADPAPSWLNEIDILITGLVIGAGTKPLHDLIARLQKSKENAGD